jgi:ADP-ribose pyrophosphatase
MPSARSFADFEIVSDNLHGAADGWLFVRSFVLRNRETDGTVSAPYTCDFVVRPVGIDAVVVALHHRAADGRVQVLLRRGLRPALALGRPADAPPIPDDAAGPWTIELVAGIVETGDRGEAGVRRRAAIEAAEEAGFTVDADDVAFLGSGTFPTPGSMPEKYWLVHVEVDPTTQHAAMGDGSPLEHHAETWWCDLDQAIADCTAGRIVDAKTEIALRRLRDLTAR